MPYRHAIVAAIVLTLHLSPSAQVRPAGWSAATHGNQAKPDYARLFALDRVHELKISIDAATFRAMREDLKSVLPIGGIPAGAGGPPGRPAGMPPMGSTDFRSSRIARNVAGSIEILSSWTRSRGKSRA